MTTKKARINEQEDTLEKFNNGGYFNRTGKFINLNYEKIKYSIENTIVYNYVETDKLFRD
jgi:hypothetical protein